VNDPALPLRLGRGVQSFEFGQATLQLRGSRLRYPSALLGLCLCLTPREKQTPVRSIPAQPGPWILAVAPGPQAEFEPQTHRIEAAGR
jgi:hypothetical protein